MKKIFTLTMLVMAFAIIANAQAPKKFWDFRHWSAETVENLKADAAWTDIEKAADSEPTAISKDNCFWEVGASGSAEGAVVTANGTPIKELEGLLNLNTKARSMAIAVNYGDCTPTNGANFGPYNGPSYLWFGGKNLNYLVIPSVKPGETIKIGVESHKISDARGVQLFVGRGNSGTKLMGPDGTDPGYPKTYEEKEWLLPAEGLADEPNADGTYDITLRNNNGCHIYFIQVGDGENKKTEVAYIHNGDISEDIVYNTIKANANYNVTTIDVAGDISAITAESLQAYDATVISSSVPADNAIVPVLKSAMPWTPILNLNADLYAAWGYGEKAVSADGIISVLKDNSSVFAGLTFIEDESMPGVKGVFVPSYNGVKLGDYFANDDILGVDLFIEGLTAIHAHNMGHNAYLYLPFSTEVMANVDEETQKMLNNALEIVAGSKSEITKARKPTFELEYKDLNTNVTIKNTNPKAQIYYTLDGTEPTTSSTLYTEPFNLTAEATVKAVAIAEGYLLSDVAEQLVEMKRQAKAPVVYQNTEDGKTTVTITCETEGASIWYNYTASADSTKSTKYTGPITVTTGKTITTFAVSDVFVQSELTTEQIVIKNAKVRIDVLAHMDANSAEFNGGSTSTKYFFSWGKDKNAYTWYDETSDPIIVKDQFGEDSLAGYSKLNPEEVVDFNNGWAIRSRGHVIIWENMKPGKNIGDGSSYNPATADDLDTLVTNAYLNIGEWNTANPRNGIIYTTQKFKGPFDVVSFISNGNSGGSPQVVFEVATDTIEGTEWTQIGDLCVLAGQRLYKKFTVSYEGTDEVFVRTRIADGNSKAGFYDIYIMNEGEKSKAYKQQLDNEYAKYASTLGDVNNDGLVAVDDVVMTINAALGDVAEDLVFEAADMNSDGLILVDDVVRVINAVLGISESKQHGVKAVAENAVGDQFYLQDFTISAGETKQVAIQFESDKVSAADPAQLEYVAFQFDIYMPEGLTITQSKGKYAFTFNEDRKDDHTFTSAVQADGSIRVLSASLTNASFWETKGDFVKFNVQAAEGFKGGKIALKKVMFSTKAGNRTELTDVEAFVSETTGIDGITTVDNINGDVYSVTGQLVKKNATTVKGLAKGVYVVNGKKVLVK